MTDKQIITNVIKNLIYVYAKVNNNSLTTAVMKLNWGRCYMVSAVLQEILSKHFHIDVEMRSNCFHSYIRYDGVDYDTLFPAGYTVPVGEFWKLKESQCREDDDLLDYGYCRCINPDISFNVATEYLTDYYRIPGNQLNDFEQAIVQNTGYAEYHIKPSTLRRQLKRFRRRAKTINLDSKSFNDLPLPLSYQVDSYPEDLWSDLNLARYGHHYIPEKSDDLINELFFHSNKEAHLYCSYYQVTEIPNFEEKVWTALNKYVVNYKEVITPIIQKLKKENKFGSVIS